jgi:hypothetical protein
VISAPLFAQQVEQPIKTTLCEIKKDPMAFNKKLVVVSGYGSHGFEDSMFDDPTCFEGAGRFGIWMEYGGTASTDTMFCCGFSPSNTKKPLIVQGVPVPLVEDDLFRHFDTLLHSKPRKEVSVHATVRGRIFVAPQKIGQLTFAGYGHMGCCMLLAIEQVLSVDSKKAESSIFDLVKKYEAKNQ